MKTKPIKYPYYLLVAMCLGLTARAQKLPNVQPGGMLAPANIKIDGKATEWNNRFLAYNKSTSIFYMMANNADNLYLIVQATNRDIINKILSNGMTLTILNPKDKTITPVAITSPLLPRGKRAPISSFQNNAASDSALNLANKELDASLKEIQATGINNITDAAISVYNEYGIKIYSQLDINKVYTLELSLPIKYISQLIVADNLNYKVQLNGISANSSVIVINGGSDNTVMTKPAGDNNAATLSSSAIVSSLNSMRSVGGAGGNAMEMLEPTNFSGAYTLVKK